MNKETKWVIFLVFLAVSLWYVCIYRTEKVKIDGVVLSHHTSSDRAGRIIYYTLARFNDGYIRSMEGIEYFILKEGDSVYYYYYKFK